MREGQEERESIVNLCRYVHVLSVMAYQLSMR